MEDKRSYNYKILFIDDRYQDRTAKFLNWLPKRIRTVITVSTAEDAIVQLATNKFTHVFLDYDLDWSGTWSKEICGMLVADFIINSRTQIDKIIIHSTNTDGGKAMKEKLQTACYFVKLYPFEPNLMKRDALPVLYEGREILMGLEQ